MAIYQCGCTQNSKGSEQAAKFQDKEYGAGRRLYTSYGTGSAESAKKQRCTVCAKTR